LDYYYAGILGGLKDLLPEISLSEVNPKGQNHRDIEATIGSEHPVFAKLVLGGDTDDEAVSRNLTALTASACPFKIFICERQIKRIESFMQIVRAVLKAAPREDKDRAYLVVNLDYYEGNARGRSLGQADVFWSPKATAKGRELQRLFNGPVPFRERAMREHEPSMVYPLKPEHFSTFAGTEDLPEIQPMLDDLGIVPMDRPPSEIVIRLPEGKEIRLPFTRGTTITLR